MVEKETKCIQFTILSKIIMQNILTAFKTSTFDTAIKQITIENSMHNGKQITKVEQIAKTYLMNYPGT